MSDAAISPAFPTEADVDAVLEEFHGDARAALRGLLLDLDALAADYDRSVSRGYVRGQARTGRRALGQERRQLELLQASRFSV